MAVELRQGEIRTGQLQYLVGLAQLANLALELLDALLLNSGRACSRAAVTLALAHTFAQRLGRAADLARDRLDRRPLLRVLILGVEDHAYRTLLNLGGKLRGLPHHGSILNRRSPLRIRGSSLLAEHRASGLAMRRNAGWLLRGTFFAHMWLYRRK